jgi:hypothetical protein
VLDDKQLEQELEIESTVKETVWIMDPAVDLEATDIREWYDTGEGYVLKRGQEASVIRYRSLDPRQQREAGAQAYDLNQLAKQNIEDLDKHALAGECARFGVVSIKGIDLKRRRYHGITGLRDDAMVKLARLTFDNKKDLGGVEGLPSNTSLQDWIGGLIALNTFRD